MADHVLNSLKRLNRGVAVLVGIMLMTCAAFVLADIFLRQVGTSFGGTDEISGYAMAIATSWGMGFTLMELGHVRIDLLRSRTGPKGRAVFDLFSMLVMSGVVTLIAIKAWPVLDRSLSMGSRANTPLETLLWTVHLPWFAGWVWFAAMSWLTFAAALMLVAQGRFGASEVAIGTFGEEEAAR